MKIAKNSGVAIAFYVLLSILCGIGIGVFLLPNRVVNTSLEHELSTKSNSVRANQAALKTETPDFVWSPSMSSAYPDLVRFSSGGVLRTAKGPLKGLDSESFCEHGRLEIGEDTPDSEFLNTGACDSLVFIKAVYPNATNAKVAIASTNCGGSMCNEYSDYYVIFNNDYGLSIRKIGTNFRAPNGKEPEFSFWFNGDSISKSTITDFFNGELSEYGDLLPSTKEFVAKKDYIDGRFNKKFVELVGQHPETLLSHEEFRKPIADMISPEKFLEIRSYMTGPGYYSLVNGRFLILSACRKHSCQDAYGSIVLDGYTGEIQVLIFAPGLKYFNFISSRPLDEKTDAEWVEKINSDVQYNLWVAGGTLSAKFKE